MSTEVAKTTNQSLTITDLYEDKELAVRESQLAVILNAAPHQSWVKKHPVYQTEYIPISRVEWLMTRIFNHWYTEVKSVVLMANSVVVTVRVHYRNVDGEMLWTDGMAAVPLQVDKGANPMDINSVKQNAIMLAVPIAKSQAFKDAVECLGRIFGKDLNRRDVPDYMDGLTKYEKSDKYAGLLDFQTEKA